MELPIISAILHSSVSKLGESQILLLIRYRGNRYKKSAGLKSIPANFNGLIIGTDTLSAKKNREIKAMILVLEESFFNIALTREITANDIKEVLAGSAARKTTIKDVVEKVRALYVGKYAAGTLKHWAVVGNHIDEFRPGITVPELDNNMLANFEGWLRKNGAKQNTVNNVFKNLFSILNKAKQLKIIDKLYYEGYKRPEYRQTKRGYLTPDEVQQLENYADTGVNNLYRLVCAWFVFACYSGMRYGDLNVWNEAKMITGDSIYFSDEKTGTPHYIPLYADLRRAVERVRNFRSIPENQVCNRYLKEVCSALSITTRVTMHVARHTFAVTYLNRGGSKDVLQPLLGHKSAKSTAIYAAITNSRIDDETGKVWGK